MGLNRMEPKRTLQRCGVRFLQEQTIYKADVSRYDSKVRLISRVNRAGVPIQLEREGNIRPTGAHQYP